MRLCQALGGLANAEIAVFRVSTQTVGLEILVAIMVDGDALFRPRPFCGRYATRLGLAVLGLDGFSRAGFAGCLVGNCLARRRFFLGGGAGRGPRCRLLLGHRRSPLSCRGRTVSTFRGSLGGLSESEPTMMRRDCGWQIRSVQPEHAVDGAQF